MNKFLEGYHDVINGERLVNVGIVMDRKRGERVVINVIIMFGTVEEMWNFANY